jgi:hypothetical protein
MKISKKSWHYRLLKWSYPKDKLVNKELPQKSFCEYFAHLIALIFIGLPLLAVMMVILGIPVVIIEWCEKRWPKKENKEWEPKTLVGQWVKAKKEKVCPLLRRNTPWNLWGDF